MNQISFLMKRAVLIISAIFFMSTGLLAQKTMDIKTDLFSAILRTGTLKFENAFTEDISVQLGFFYTGFHAFGTETTVRGYGITPEFRYYLSSTPAPNGTYLAPNVRYYSFTLADPDVTAEGTLTNVSLAVNLGKQVLLKDVVVIDAWVGPSYNFRSISSSEYDLGFSGGNGFGMRLGIAIGIAF